MVTVNQDKKENARDRKEKKPGAECSGTVPSEPESGTQAGPENQLAMFPETFVYRCE